MARSLSSPPPAPLADLVEDQRFGRASAEERPDKGVDARAGQEIMLGPLDRPAAGPKRGALRGGRAEEMSGKQMSGLVDSHPIQRVRVRRGGEVRCRGVEVAGREGGPAAACAGARGADKGRDLGAALPEKAIGEARQIRRGDVRTGPGEDGAHPGAVGGRDGDVPVEPPRAPDRRVDGVGMICRGEQDDAFRSSPGRAGSAGRSRHRSCSRCGSGRARGRRRSRR